MERLYPLFGSIAPGVDAAERTPGRSGTPSPSESGFLHCGPNGAGHFVKMVHNGIEYGIMAAYAEGLNILHSANVGKAVLDGDAETAPMAHPEYYQYDINTAEVTEVWRRGSVVSSWLLDLTAQALLESPTLEDFSGRVSDSGEGRWTSIAAIDEGVPTPVLTAALYSRFGSRGLDNFADRTLVGDAEAVWRTRREGVRLEGRRRPGLRAMNAVGDFEREKRLVAVAAADIVQSGMIVGLGTGSTVGYLLPALAARRLDVRCVTSSPATERAARELGIEVEPFTGPDAPVRVDLTIDGADQVAPSGWLVKGGGAAHTREKAIATAADGSS